MPFVCVHFAKSLLCAKFGDTSPRDTFLLFLCELQSYGHVDADQIQLLMENFDEYSQDAVWSFIRLVLVRIVVYHLRFTTRKLRVLLIKNL